MMRHRKISTKNGIDQNSFYRRHRKNIRVLFIKIVYNDENIE